MKLLFRIATSLLVTVVVIYAGIFLWTKVLHPAEDKLNSDDLTAVVTDTSPQLTTEAPTQMTDPTQPSDVSGVWKATTKSTLGYRVNISSLEGVFAPFPPGIHVSVIFVAGVDWHLRIL